MRGDTTNKTERVETYYEQSSTEIYIYLYHLPWRVQGMIWVEPKALNKANKSHNLTIKKWTLNLT